MNLAERKEELWAALKAAGGACMLRVDRTGVGLFVTDATRRGEPLAILSVLSEQGYRVVDARNGLLTLDWSGKNYQREVTKTLDMQVQPGPWQDAWREEQALCALLLASPQEPWVLNEWTIRCLRDMVRACILGDVRAQCMQIRQNAARCMREGVPGIAHIIGIWIAAWLWEGQCVGVPPVTTAPCPWE